MSLSELEQLCEKRDLVEYNLWKFNYKLTAISGQAIIKKVDRHEKELLLQFVSIVIEQTK